MPWQVEFDDALSSKIDNSKHRNVMLIALKALVRDIQLAASPEALAYFGHTSSGYPAFFVNGFVVRCRLNMTTQVCTIISISM